MHVRKRLRLNTVVSATAVLVVALVLFMGLHRISSAFEELDIADEILNGLFQRNTLLHDYLMTSNERARVQWLAEHTQIRGALETASKKFEDPEDRNTIADMIRDHDATGKLFTGIVANRVTTRSGAVPPELSRAIENRQLTQLNIRLYSKVLYIQSLRDSSRGRVFSELKRTGGGIVLLVVVLAGMVAFGSWTIGRVITNRISRLREGTAIVGQGDLEHRIGIEGDDEFADLSRAFDAATEKLSRSYLSLQTEIDERKRAEEELRTQREWLRVTLESIGDAVMAVDTGGRVTFLNPVAGELTGWQPAEALGRPVESVFRVINENTRRPGEDIIGNVLVEGPVAELANHTTLISRDGREIPIEDSAAPIRDSAGNVSGVVLVFHDVTEKRRAEEVSRNAHDELEVRVRERTAELEHRNRELQNFTFVAAHDLQEPLRKIQTFGDLVADRCSGSVGEAGLDYIRRMRETAARMQQVLHSLLEYSRLTSEAKPLGRVDLNEVARGVISDFELKIRDSGSTVEIGSLHEIEADAGQMNQLLQNLIGNALKFSRAGERPLVKIRSERGDGSADGKCRIYVEDNGIGFDEKYLDKIFTPFQRLHARDEYGGIGMGLAICSKIAERHGGTITAKSAAGKGSTFIVTLPVSRGGDE